MKKVILFLIIVLVLIVSSVYAQPPVQTIVIGADDGLIIEAPFFSYHAQNSDFQFHFHIFNKSNGVYLTNNTVDCLFDLYNSSGNHIIESARIEFSKDFSYLVSKDNFTNIGSYSYLVLCNATSNGYNLGGGLEFEFEITPDGRSTNSKQGLIMLAVIFLMVSITFIFFYATIKINKLLIQFSLMTFTLYFISFDFFFTGRLFEIIDPFQINTINSIYNMYSIMLNLSHVMLIATTIYWLYYLYTWIMVSPREKRKEEERGLYE